MTTIHRLLFTSLALLVPAVFALVLLQWSIAVSALAGHPHEGADSGSSAIHEKNHELIQCSEEKGKVTELLLAGKLSLAQTIEEFRRINDDLERVRPARMTFPIPRSDQALAKSVMSWAHSQGSQRPDCTAMLHRLEQELQQLFPHHRSGYAALH